MTTIEKGDKILIRRAITDSAGNPILFTALSTVTAKLEHQDTTEYETYTKAGSTVVQGSTTSEIEFEVTPAHSAAFAGGIIYAIYTFTFTDTNFSSNTAQIVRHEPLFNVREKV